METLKVESDKMNTKKSIGLDRSDHINNDDYDNIESPWTVIESYFKGQHLQRLIRHQLESYNNFISLQLPNTIEMFNPTHIVSENDYDSKNKKYSLEIFISL